MSIGLFIVVMSISLHVETTAFSEACDALKIQEVRERSYERFEPITTILGVSCLIASIIALLMRPRY